MIINALIVVGGACAFLAVYGAIAACVIAGEESRREEQELKELSMQEFDNRSADKQADEAEVIRCKDCGKCVAGDHHELWCTGWGQPMRLVPPSGYCYKAKPVKSIDKTLSM